MNRKHVSMLLTAILVCLLGVQTVLAQSNQAAVFNVAPVTLEFGVQRVGTTSLPQTITITNNEAADLEINSVAITGEFILGVDLCSNITVNAGGSCTVEIIFAPISEGNKVGEVSIPSNAVTPLDNITLNGVGVAPGINSNPTSLDFFRQAYGTVSGSQTTTITNPGTADLIVGEISITGEFAISGDLCSNQIIIPNGSCAIDVTFSPDSTGIKTGEISIPSNADTSPYIIPLTGTGMAKVWYVALTGDDVANDCLTPSTPCLTINGAIGKAVSNGVIKVAKGTYAETVLLHNMNMNLFGGWNNGFTEQSGYSIIDMGGTTSWGENGITTNANVTITNFLIQNCFFGLHNYGGNITFKNSALVNNRNGLYNYEGNVTIINATISGNQNGGYAGSAIINVYGNINIQYSTITNNSQQQTPAIDSVYPGTRIQIGNSILANNKNGDCSIGSSNNLISKGNNIFGSNPVCDHPIKTQPTDLVGVDPLITYINADGVHALKATSPAIDNGNPLNCPPNDQRGASRPSGAGCDIGAYEGFVLSVKSVTRSNPNPTGVSTIGFTVTFSKAVTGVETSAPFKDFSLTKTGVSSAVITSVTGSGDTYQVIVKVGKGNGTVKLNVLDDDSIVDVSSAPLGGEGNGNGDFTTGESYTILRIPVAKAPTGTIADATPSYKWTKIPDATKYRYQVTRGSSVVFTKIIDASVCTTTICLDTSTTKMENNSYDWKVQAMVEGQWKEFSSPLSFVVSVVYPPDAGFWKGTKPEYSEFYVTKDKKNVDNFAIYVTVTNCDINNEKLIHEQLVPINNNRFSKSGSYYFKGTFTTKTTAKGTFGLNWYYWPGCGFIGGGPFEWNNTWINSSQPPFSITIDVIVSPALDTPLDYFTHFHLVNP